MTPNNRRIFLCFILVIFASLSAIAQETKTPKNIIMLIGDGMGVPHITATAFEKGTLNLSRFKKVGLQTTFSGSDYVTDSAAAGTALATGHKTTNGCIGMSLEEKPFKSVAEYADKAGKATGIVVTSCVTHATPAAYSAHVISRYMYDEIAEQQVNGGLDVMFGGGLQSFMPKYMRGSKRKDNKDPMSQLRKKMPVVQTIEAFRKLGTPKQAAAILAPNHLPVASKRDYSLAELSNKAIQILNRNEKGFFLMIEGSQIDFAGHSNDYQKIMSETLDFDGAVKEALDFAEKDGNTLVVVTADHETGGLTLTGGSIADKTIESKFSTDGHSGCMVAVFAYGPGSDLFTGIYDNTHIGQSMIELVK